MDEDALVSPGQSQGPSVDRTGQPVVDPTANVLALVKAETKRQDDLREMITKHLESTARIRAQYEDRLRAAETSRIDAIRQVDVGNVQRAAEVQAGVAAALEGKVAQTAAAFESRLTATIEPIQRRIDDLTRAQYEAQGQKTQVVEARAETADLAPVLEAISRLTQASENAAGAKQQVTETRASTSAIVAIVGGSIGGLLGLVSLVALFVSQGTPGG